MGKKVRTFLLVVGILLCLTSLLLPWWSMSASLTAGSYGYYNIGYTVSASANLLWVTGGFRSIPAYNELDIKSSYLVFGEKYWFGWSAFSLIAIGSLLSAHSLLTAKVNTALKRRFYNFGFALIVIGISVFLLGLEFSLNSAHLIGKQVSLFQDLSVLSGNFGNTYFGLFGSGTGFQLEPFEIPYRGAVFFPNSPLHYISTLSYGFFFALSGIILMGSNVKRKEA